MQLWFNQSLTRQIMLSSGKLAVGALPGNRANATSAVAVATEFRTAGPNAQKSHG